MSTATPEIETYSRPRPRGGLVETARAVLKPVASLRITVGLFALSIGLVFFGTIAQMNAGIFTVVEKYFWSWYVMVELQLLVQVGQKFLGLPSAWRLPGKFPFPGGILLGGAMLVNLLAAHTLQLINLVSAAVKTAQKGKARSEVVRVLAKRSGIYVLHAGVILLFVGEFVTRTQQVEQRMVIREGQTVDYAFDTRNHEFAVTSAVPGDPTRSTVTVVPARFLKPAVGGGRVTHPDLPVDVQVLTWMDHHRLVDAEEATPEARAANPATAGIGRVALALPLDEAAGTDTEQTLEVPAAYVRLFRKGTNDDLGTYLVSADSGREQPVAVGDAQHEIALRFKRIVKPFSLRLEKFTHEDYPGTSVPKTYASRLRLVDPDRKEDRDVTIEMNEPLRHRWEAFFQAGYDETAPAGAPQTTILQVMKNPGWILPYASCVLVTVGMLVHFLLVLIPFLKRTVRQGTGQVGAIQDAAVAAALRAPWLVRRLPAVAVGFGLLVLLGTLAPRSKDANGLDYSDLGSTPVVDDGRLKPLDTAARIALRQMNQKESVGVDGGTARPALQWFLDTATLPEPRVVRESKELPAALRQKMFRIDNPGLLDLLKLERRDGLRYSFEEFSGRLMELDRAATAAKAVPEKQRNPFEQKTLELRTHIGMYQQVWEGAKPLMLPPAEGDDWRTPQAAEAVLGHARQQALRRVLGHLPPDFSAEQLQNFIQNDMPAADRKALAEELDAIGRSDAALSAWEAVQSAYRRGDAKKFAAATAEYRAVSSAKLSSWDRFRIGLEVFLNRTGWYWWSALLYGLVLLLSLVGLVLVLGAPEVSGSFRRAAFWLMVLTFAAHTFTLFARMAIMERPLVFVTNLVSSAMFIGWAAVGVGILLEVVFRLTLGNLVGSVLGLATCLVSHNLAVAGDDIEPMRAVLNTNPWLASHVTTVTFGYAATYVAGFIGLLYLILGIGTPLLGRRARQSAVAVEAGPTWGQVFNKALYGVVCAAMLFSFVGTVLGGIWADQSWGRFWGWDPKENGAVLIVIWNALILHARWCGMVKTRGMAILALVGNMITTWSWFGTNQLGVGLHAYGFNSTLANFCNVIWFSHAAVIAIALLVPTRRWASDPRTSG